MKGCRAPFLPSAPHIEWCSDDCAVIIGLARLAVQKAKAAKEERAKAKRERADDQAKRETFKRRADYIAELQVVFNSWVRERDRGKPCICCGKMFDPKDIHGGQFDAGHYLSRGSAPHLRFDERNVHRQIKGHNRPGGTTRESFRKGMIERIGLEALLALESDCESRDYTIEDLKAMKADYAARLRALKP